MNVVRQPDASALADPEIVVLPVTDSVQLNMRGQSIAHSSGPGRIVRHDALAPDAAEFIQRGIKLQLVDDLAIKTR